jgi:hypothetical protein
MVIINCNYNKQVLARMWWNRNSCTLLMGIQFSITTWKAVWRFLKKLEIELPFDPVILLLGIYQKTVRWDTVETPVHQCSLQH